MGEPRYEDGGKRAVEGRKVELWRRGAGLGGGGGYRDRMRGERCP